MAALLQFPTEILDQILGHLPCADLAALYRVHRTFHLAAEPLLYNSVELSWTKKENPPVVQLLRTILTRPALALHVGQVKLLGRDFDLTRRTPDPHGIIRNLPPKVTIASDEQKIFTDAIEDLPLPYVSSWEEELRAGTMDAMVALLLMSVPNIKSLRIESNFTIEARLVGNLFRSAVCERSGTDLPSFVDLQEVIYNSKHSQFRGRCFPQGNTHEVLPLFYLPAARSLDLFVDTPPSGVFDWPPGPPNLSNLTSLRLSMLRETSLKKVLSATPCLKSLRWEWYYGPSYSRLPWGQTINLDQVVSALVHVQDTLESLDITAWADYGTPSDIELDPLEIRGTLRPLASFPKLRNLTAPWCFVAGFAPDTGLRLEDVVPSSVESLVLKNSLMSIDAWEWEDYEMVELFPPFFENRRAVGRQLRELEVVVKAGGASTEWAETSVARPRLAEICSGHNVKLKITTTRFL
ncbi:F-box domain protein [Colletotrichum plurivorum]|uniref:F-box domain protein n=1 Tax=Colletotrichum plurivorum TaxID=2175906 RepID=A0A8H6NHW9_9PEZI|nr:F-box domain protein [Colletotrichum plurivorum]